MRSQHVLYGVVGAVVLACTGGFIYDRSQKKTCVDSTTMQVVDDDRCRLGASPYRWYYGGHSGGIGTKATGGSYERGGFGRLFSGGGGG